MSYSVTGLKKCLRLELGEICVQDFRLEISAIKLHCQVRVHSGRRQRLLLHAERLNFRKLIFSLPFGRFDKSMPHFFIVCFLFVNRPFKADSSPVAERWRDTEKERAATVKSCRLNEKEWELLVWTKQWIRETSTPPHRPAAWSRIDSFCVSGSLQFSPLLALLLCVRVARPRRAGATFVLSHE